MKGHTTRGLFKLNTPASGIMSIRHCIQSCTSHFGYCKRKNKNFHAEWAPTYSIKCIWQFISNRQHFFFWEIMDYSFEGVPFLTRLLKGRKFSYFTSELDCAKMTSQISESKHPSDIDLLRMTKNKRILVKDRMQLLCFPARIVPTTKFCWRHTDH